MDIIKPYGHTDILFYYSTVAKKLVKFLKGKEIATKILLPKGPMPFFLKRGSKQEPLYIEGFLKAVTPEFLEIRKNIERLGDAKPKLNKLQINVWEYFVPRKLVNFYYATNKEGAGKPIERIFFDIDRKEIIAEKAQQVTKLLIDLILKDKEFKKLIKFKLFVMWTGSSFHVYLFLDKPVTTDFYNKYLHFSKNDPLASFTGRWAKEIKEKLKINVIGGHEKIKNTINIDPSQTPSGKLARAPFCLHFKDAGTVDGIAIPLTVDMLNDKGLVKKLKAYTPKKVVDELEKLAKRLPK